MIDVKYDWFKQCHKPMSQKNSSTKSIIWMRRILSCKLLNCSWLTTATKIQYVEVFPRYFQSKIDLKIFNSVYGSWFFWFLQTNQTYVAHNDFTWHQRLSKHCTEQSRSILTVVDLWTNLLSVLVLHLYSFISTNSVVNDSFLSLCKC